MNRWVKAFLRRKLNRREYFARNGLVLVFVLLVTLLLPKDTGVHRVFVAGETWEEADLYAPFTFFVYRNPAEVQAEQRKAALQVQPVFRLDTVVKRQVRTKIIRELDSLLPYHSRAAEVALNKALDKIYTPGLLSVMRDSLAYGGQAYNFIALRAGTAVEHLTPASRYADRGQAIRLAEAALEGLSEDEQVVLLQSLIREMRPSVIYDSATTEMARANQARIVSPISGKVKSGDKLVSRGDVMKPETITVLESLAMERGERAGLGLMLTRTMAQFLLVLIITSIFLLYLGVHRKDIFLDQPRLALALCIMLLGVLMLRMAQLLDGVTDARLMLEHLYLAPVCLVPIMLTNFFDERTGAMGNMTLALFGGVLVKPSIEFILIQICVGLVTVYSLRRMRQRRVFFYTLGYIFAAYMVVYAAYELFRSGSLLEIPAGNFVLFALNVALTITAYPLIYGLERLFRVTSDLTYLELLDTNHPLLQDLLRKAPGTFQHSLQVANIAEAGINMIGGNPLLVHVGALYHDIGKVRAPHYFIENRGEDDNPHDRLAPLESAAIIVKHVRDGLTLAQELRLPPEVTEFIRTHHGTTRVDYFYHSYLKEKGLTELEDDSAFRYPGPKPYTKEMAVLMLADSVEAASHTLTRPTSEDLMNLINSIIDRKMKNNQLDDAPITFRDLSKIRKTFHKQLLSIYHGRIEYPE